MKQMIGMLMAVAVLGGVTAAYAGDGCCAASKARAAVKSGCDASFAALKLSDEQKAKIDALVAECQKTQCSKTAAKKFRDGVKAILTAEQYAQWEQECAKARKAGTCPASQKSES